LAQAVPCPIPDKTDFAQKEIFSRTSFQALASADIPKVRNEGKEFSLNIRRPFQSFFKTFQKPRRMFLGCFQRTHHLGSFFVGGGENISSAKRRRVY
jgi:hypothetical protein